MTHQKSDQTNQSQQIKESLSALMDDATSPQEIHALLNQLEKDPTLRETALNYQCIGDVIRNENNHFSEYDISHSVNKALTNEPSHKQEKIFFIPTKNRRPFTQMAIAASITLAVILGANYSGLLGTNNSTNNYAVQETFSPQLLQSSDPIAGSSLSSSKKDSALSSLVSGHFTHRVSQEQQDAAKPKRIDKAHSKLNAYLLHHAQNVANYQGQSILPFARMTTQNLYPVFSE